MAKGDIAVAVKTFQLYTDYSCPFAIEILMCRSLLVACMEVRYSDMAQNVFNLLMRWNVFPSQRMDKPRKIIVPLWMTFNEMLLTLKEYMKWLYNSLCDALLENTRLTSTDLQLCVMLSEHLAPSGQQVWISIRLFIKILGLCLPSFVTHYCIKPKSLDTVTLYF